MKRLLFATVSALALTCGVAQADPITAAIAATAASAAGTLIAGGTLVFSQVLAQFAVRAVLGYAMNALSSSQSRGAPVTRGYQSANPLGPVLPHPVIYGQTRVGGVVFYQALTTGTSANDRLHRCIAFAGHEVTEFTTVYFNDEALTLDESGNVTAPAKWVGKARVKIHLGADDQTADTDLVSEVSEWDTNCRAQGIAYLYVRFQDAAAFPSGIPIVTALIKGKAVHDPRDDSTGWSDNPALCIRDYLLSDYGLGETPSGLNDTLIEAAADACDELVSGAKIYTLNGAFTLDAEPEQIIRNLLSAMGGIFWNYAGQWALQAAEYREPTLTLDENDLRGELTLATRHSRRDNFNTVQGQFKGAATDYQPDSYAPVGGGVWLAEDNGIRSASELNLLFTDTETMARRVAQTFLRRNRAQETVSGAFGLRALNLKVGDNVRLSVDHLGYDEKVFEVVDWRLGMKELDIHVNMILREMSAEVFEGIAATLLDESGNALLDESGNELLGTVA